MKSIAFVTSSIDPAISVDDQLAASAMASMGMSVVPAVWDDPTVDWGTFAASVLRSPWDYHQKVDAFVSWLRRLNADGAPVWNPPSVVLGNLNKRYLLHLEHRGVGIVPTEFVPAGMEIDLADLLDHRGWKGAIVKPAVSLGGFGTWKVSRETASSRQAQFAAEVLQGDRLVQEDCSEIETDGEWSLVFLGGAYSHAILKRPAPGDFRVQFHFGGSAVPAQAPAALVEQASSILSLVPGRLLYARVDGIERAGRLVLMELEITEPNLFFACEPGAPERFAKAVAAVL